MIPVVASAAGQHSIAVKGRKKEEGKKVRKGERKKYILSKKEIKTWWAKKNEKVKKKANK